MEYKLIEQELQDLMHRCWLKAKKFYNGKTDEYFYDHFESEKKQLTIHSVVERYLFEGRDLTNNQPFKKVIDAENRESAIANMEVTYPHLKWVMNTKV